MNPRCNDGRRGRVELMETNEHGITGVITLLALSATSYFRTRASHSRRATVHFWSGDYYRSLRKQFVRARSFTLLAYYFRQGVINGRACRSNSITR